MVSQTSSPGFAFASGQRLHVVARGRRPGSAARRARHEDRSRTSTPRRPCRSRRRSRTASCRRCDGFVGSTLPSCALLGRELGGVDLADVADELRGQRPVRVGADRLASHLHSGELVVVLADVELEVLGGQVADDRDEVERAPSLDRCSAAESSATLVGQVELGEGVGEVLELLLPAACREIGLSVWRFSPSTRLTRLSTITRPFRSRMRPRGPSSWIERRCTAWAVTRYWAGEIPCRYHRRAKRLANSERQTIPTMVSRVREVSRFRHRGSPTMADDRSSGPSAHRHTLSINGDRSPPMTAITPTILHRWGFERVCSPNISPPTA